MTEMQFDPEILEASPHASLVLGRRTTPTRIKGERVRMHTDVGEALRGIAGQTLESLSTLQPVSFSDDLHLDAEENYILIPRDKLTRKTSDTPSSLEPGPEPDSPVIEVNALTLDLLDNSSALNLIDRTDLKQQTFLMYALTVGSGSTGRMSFVKQQNPYKSAQLGQILTQFGDGLRKISDKVLTFATDFDMVVTDDYVAVLRPAAFEKLFREIDSLRDRIPTWSSAAISALPLSDESAQLIQQIALSSNRVATQLRGMNERGYLTKQYRIADLELQMKKADLDCERLIVDGKLKLAERDVPLILRLVDEKLYRGWHSSTQWDVGTRASR